MKSNNRQKTKQSDSKWPLQSDAADIVFVLLSSLYLIQRVEKSPSFISDVCNDECIACYSIAHSLQISNYLRNK